MLLMIRAESAVVGTTMYGCRIKAQRCLGWFEEVAGSFVIFDVDGNEDFLKTVLEAGLKHINALVLKNDFGFHLLQAGTTQTICQLVKDVGTFADGRRHFDSRPHEFLGWRTG